MIQKVIYKPQSFCVEFEHPLFPAVLDAVESLRGFIEKAEQTRGANVIREESAIAGLEVTYDTWCEWVGELDTKGPKVDAAAEFRCFFETLSGRGARSSGIENEN